MQFIDTHAHLYLEEFSSDKDIIIRQALAAGVTGILLPNIDSTSHESLMDFCRRFPGQCFPMAGLHPTSVTPETIESELNTVEQQLETGSFVAVGEIGIDLYWDKTHQALQEEAFRFQVKLAKKHGLPVAIHVRKSFDEVWQVLKTETGSALKGVFHCFPGDERQARKVIEVGFLLGIGGVVTFKNAGLQQVVSAVGMQHLVLETDAPYLTPMPFRGKRNQPAYIPLVAAKIAELCKTTTEEVAEITTRNAAQLFNLKI